MRAELDRIHARLIEEGEKTVAFFERLGPDEWDQQVYTTGSGWGVHQILAHFVSAERHLTLVIEDVLQGGAGAPRDLDIDEFNEADVPRLDRAGIEALIEGFRAARARMASLVESIQPEDLELRGYHPWFGETEVRNMLKLIYRHNMIHLRDVRRALDSKAPVPHVEATPPSRASNQEPVP